ncbi:Putative short-chain type dehydrogenase/reductase MSMEG_6031 [Nocardia africana]|uniref:Short-chain type dehydrogenase/reductase MSMEG_6031 n=1 Tax=Nocardia africana TaxID=134964 RepID=A0A378WUI9_9NOCA|nr:Putative short-chain type dehydrogenase/reductase MSMEG_6031 [Nocardia africana]
MKALALGANAVMIGRPYLWGMAAAGVRGVHNVLEVIRQGIDSALYGLGHSSIHDLTPEDVIVPDGFTRACKWPPPRSPSSPVPPGASAPPPSTASPPRAGVVAVDICRDDPGLGYPLGTRDQLATVAAAHAGTVADVEADVRDIESLSGAVELATERFGGLDAAVAAAAVMTGGRPLWETTHADWEPMFDIGVNGIANLARVAIPATQAVGANSPRAVRL